MCGALSAIMTGIAYKTSAEMAKELGPFPGYKKNAAHMLRVIRNHRRAAYGRPRLRSLSVNPVPLDYASCPQASIVAHASGLGRGARARRNPRLPQRAGHRGRADRHHRPCHGLRHHRHRADFALVKFKKLAGGGYFKIINRAVPAALRTLGYRESEIAEIVAYAVGHGSLSNAPGVNATSLSAKGFTDEVIAKVEKALPTAFDIKFVFNKWTLGEDFIVKQLGVSPRR